MSIHDTATPACSACGSDVRKVFGSVGVTFKGSGFYRTDSRETSKASTSTASSAD
jgi:predicted nucleic acid-binding Zn ribbon protein